MNVLQAVILGIVQGITEFLPVSSSGHLVLFQKIFRIQEPTMLFDVVLHVGTLVAVFIVFWDKIFELIKKPFQKYSYLIIAGTVPAIIVAVFLSDVIERLFDSGQFLFLAFIATGFILLYADRVANGKKNDEDIKFVDAFWIGVMQAIAIIPGVSRSGSTICGALANGLEKQTAAKFSFILSIPAILGAAVLQIKNVMTGTNTEFISFAPMFFGFVAAMLSGYLSIKFMLKLINESKLKMFSYYVFALAFFIAIDQFFLKIYFV